MWLALVGVAIARAGLAHEDPAGCFDTGAVVTVGVFRADGTTGVVGVVSECETINYRVVLQKPAGMDTECAFSGGALVVTTPDGSDHVIADPVPCVGGTTGVEACEPTVDYLASSPIPYRVQLDDVVKGLLTVRAEYTGGMTHDSPDNTAGVAAAIIKSTPVIRCDDGNACTADICDLDGIGPAACIYVDDSFVGCELCGNGAVDPLEDCDEGDANGHSGSCCTGQCRYDAAGTPCRPALGECDLAENCTGARGSCPPDAKVLAGTVCRPAAPDEECDAPEVCDGMSVECLPDSPAPNTVVCRPARNECDVADRCNGFAFFCPAVDFVQDAGVPCGRGDRCDAVGECVDTCGNGTLDPGEECDDGNAAVGDGCRDDCRSEVCGDGTKDPQEQCDDGNAAAGDGCAACRIECARDDECRGRGDCSRPLCVTGLCATQPGCTGDPCARRIRSLVEGSVTFGDVACAFDRPLGGGDCADAATRVANLDAKNRKLLDKVCAFERACSDGRPGRRLANAVRGLSGRIEKLQLRIAPQVGKLCADELSLAGGCLYDRTTLLRALAKRVKADAAGACRVASASCS